MSEGVLKRQRLDSPILTLPFDLLSYVLGNYGCLYAFNLAQVSRTFYRATKQRQFWLNAFQRQLWLKMALRPTLSNESKSLFLKYCYVLIDEYRSYIWRFIKLITTAKVTETSTYITFDGHPTGAARYLVFSIRVSSKIGPYAAFGEDFASHRNLQYVDTKKVRKTSIEYTKADDINKILFLEYHDPDTGKTFFGRGKVDPVTDFTVPDEENGAWK